MHLVQVLHGYTNQSNTFREKFTLLSGTTKSPEIISLGKQQVSVTRTYLNLQFIFMALREPGCDTDLYITEFTYLTDWYGEIPGDYFSRKTASQLLLLNSQSSNTVLWVLREPGCDKDLHHRIFLPKKALSLKLSPLETSL